MLLYPSSLYASTLAPVMMLTVVSPVHAEPGTMHVPTAIVAPVGIYTEQIDGNVVIGQ